MLWQIFKQVPTYENDRVFLVCRQLLVAKVVGDVHWRVPRKHFNYLSRRNSVLFLENLSHILKFFSLVSSPLHKAKLFICQTDMKIFSVKLQVNVVSGVQMGSRRLDIHVFQVTHAFLELRATLRHLLFNFHYVWFREILFFRFLRSLSSFLGLVGTDWRCTWLPTVDQW